MNRMIRLCLILGLCFFTIQQGAYPEPSCPKSSSEKQRSGKNNSVLDGTVKVRHITKNGREYFRARLGSSLPHFTRITLSLYYVRGEPSIKHLAYRKTVRVKKSGTITADLLALERSPWAGCYRLVIRFNPKNQVPSVREKLDHGENVIEREKNWYHGSPDQLKKQKEQAVERARRDFHQTLDLAESLRDIVRNYRNQNQRNFVVLPYSFPFHVPREWVVRSSEWLMKLERLKESNDRRPRFEGRTIPYFYVEDRTAYFLQYDLNRLEKLYEITNRLVWMNSFSQDSVQTFRKQYEKLREGVAETMTLLKLVVPLSEEKRKRLRSKLNRLKDLFQTLGRLVRDENASSDQVRQAVSDLQATIFKVNPEIPAVVYKKITSLAERLQQYSTSYDQLEQERAEESYDELYRMFQDARNLAQSFLESKFQ